MSTFTIDAENNITAFAVLPTGTDESQSFSTAKELAKLTAVWPVSRLIDTWNSFAGVAPFDELKPVKKFTSRKSAVTRIWQAIARLSPDGAQTAAPVATAKRLSPDGAQTAAPVATAKGKAKKTPAKAPRRARAQKGAEERGNKKAEVIGHDEALQRREPSRDRSRHGLAEAHGARLRQHRGPAIWLLP